MIDYLIQVLFASVILGSSSVWFGYLVITGRA